MDLVTIPTWNEYCQQHPQAKASLQEWRRLVESNTWHSFAELRLSNNKVDRVGKCFVVNIAGNRFRLIAGIRFVKLGATGHPTRGIVYLKGFMTHAEYDRNQWQEDCGCLD